MAGYLDSGVAHSINTAGADSSGRDKVSGGLCADCQAVARTLGFPISDAVDPRTLLMWTVIGVVTISMLKIVVHIFGRWYATRITKRIQLDVRHRVFEHAVRLPLHRVQEIRSGGVASILREDGGSVGELVFGLLYNPWRAIIQLTGSLIILAWVDWTLLLGAVVLLPLVFLSHRTWISPHSSAVSRDPQTARTDRCWGRGSVCWHASRACV